MLMSTAFIQAAVILQIAHAQAAPAARRAEFPIRHSHKLAIANISKCLIFLDKFMVREFGESNRFHEPVDHVEVKQAVIVEISELA